MASPLLAMRERFDPTVTTWPGVAKRTMMGHPGYGVRGKLFAFFDTGQVVLKCPDERRDELLARPGSLAWVPPGSDMAEKYSFGSPIRSFFGSSSRPWLKRGAGCGIEVESRGSCPAIASRTFAQSSTERANGATWSSELAKARSP